MRFMFIPCLVVVYVVQKDKKTPPSRPALPCGDHQNRILLLYMVKKNGVTVGQF